jgi:hypothetical protein
MRAEQAGFDFDIFEMAGFTQATVEDFGAQQRRNAEAKARMDAQAEERRRNERAHRERERKERTEREREQRRGAYSSPHDILGVPFGSSKSEVRAAWVRLCRTHHPDRGGDIETMKRINNAWNQLKGNR